MRPKTRDDYYNDDDYYDDNEGYFEEDEKDTEAEERNEEDYDEYDEDENEDRYNSEEDDDYYDEDDDYVAGNSSTKKWFYDKDNPADFFQIMEDYNSGDPVRAEAACEKAIIELDGMVRSIIRDKYSRYCQKHYDDLIQQGRLGICKGLQTYDPTKGKHTTYLYRYILHEMHEWINTMVNKTTSHYDACTRKIKKTIDRYNDENRPYTAIDISIDTKIPIQTVEESLRRMNSGDLSLDTGVDASNGTLENLLPSDEKTPEQLYVEQENLITLDNVIHRYLDADEIRVVELMYGIHGCPKMNTKMISRELNLPSDRVRRYENSALSKLRRAKELKSLHADMLRNTMFEVDEENAIPLLSDVELDAALEIMKEVEIDF